MSYKPVKLEDATAAQRLTYARTLLNLESIDEAASDEQVISAIRAAQPNSPNIFVEDVDQAAEDHSAEARERGNPIGMQLATAGEGDGAQMKGSLGRNDPRCTIFIRGVDQADGLGQHDVPVGVNGVVWQLKRNMDLEVPWRVVEALGLTDQDIIRHDPDSGDVKITTARRIVVEFPHGMPSYDQIKAWRQETDDKFCP